MECDLFFQFYYEKGDEKNNTAESEIDEIHGEFADSTTEDKVENDDKTNAESKFISVFVKFILPIIIAIVLAFLFNNKTQLQVL